jgi:acetate kinase
MKEIGPYIIITNGGSSSIKYSIIAVDTLAEIVSANVSGIGLTETRIETHIGGLSLSETVPSTTTFADALLILQKGIEGHIHGTCVAYGYRVVHGGTTYTHPTRIDQTVIKTLRSIVHLAPMHLPTQIAIIETMTAARPDIPHVACFDTAFHTNLPRTAQLTGLPRSYEERGIRRYGFHGLSYEYIVGELARAQNTPTHTGSAIIAHLGNGDSVCAIRDGASVDTSMGYTPAAGLLMSTRCGDIDPGIVIELARKEGMTPDAIEKLLNEQSGLLGVSGTSGDMKKLLEIEATDPHAAEAVALFCYDVKKYIGAYAAILGSLDTLVFSGGIGEKAPKIRARICAGLEHLGIILDAAKNDAQEAVISTPESKVTVRIVHTDENRAIAQHVIATITS